MWFFYKKSQVIDFCFITILSVIISIVEISFLLFVYAVISEGSYSINLFNLSFNADSISGEALVISSVILLLFKIIIIVYTNFSCKKFGYNLYSEVFFRFSNCYSKNNLDWNALFSIHLNIVTNSIYRSVLALASSFAYFLLFFLYIASSLSLNTGWLLLFFILLTSGVVAIVFYMFKNIAPNFVHKVNLHLNFINSILKSRFFYFSGAASISVLTNQYHDLVEKLKTVQAVQQIFHELPRYLFEVMLILCLLLIVLAKEDHEGSVGEVILLSVRLLPVLSNIFSNMANIYTNRSAFELVCGVLKQSRPEVPSQLIQVDRLGIKGLMLKHNDKVFRYEDMDFVFNSSIYRIAGPSGSGKSSLLLAIVGQRDADAGNILVNGRSGRLRELYKSAVFVSSEFDFPEALSIGELIVEAPLKGRLDIQICYSVFFPELVKKNILLPKFLKLTGDEVSKTFSAGQKQRLAHFIALSSNSRVLISDEGFCHIDHSLRRDIMNLYMNNNIYNGILLVEHDLDFLEGFDVQEIQIDSSR